MSSKITRSRRLKKYEQMYMRYIDEKTPQQKSPRKSRRKIEVEIEEIQKEKKRKKKKKKKLNDYQKFVKNESKKEKYKGISSSERFTTIASQWDIHKKISK
jgi:hypothetical protein